MELDVLEDIVSIFLLSAGMLLIASRLKFPSIVAFLLAGMVAGPHGLKIVTAVEHVDLLATIGIVLLLFTIGMEFSVRKLIQMKEMFFVAGSIQVFGTTLLGFLAALLFGKSMGQAAFLGCLLALSSTAIVMKSLEQRREAEAPHGKLILGISIFQDVISIPMLLMIPLFAGGVVSVDSSFFYALLKGISILVLIFLLADHVIPRLMYRIARTKNRELFLLSIFAICFSVAWVTTQAGLPLSLGAFLAGLTVSESEYRHQAIGDILPFQDIFTCFFFVSIGMLLDINFVVNQPFLIAGLTAGVLFFKATIATLAGVAVKMPIRSAAMGGIFLSQVGEFSFILARTGISEGLFSPYLYQLFLAVSLFSMAISPYLIDASAKITRLLQKLPLPDWLMFGIPPKHQAEKLELKSHVVILGFGVSGRNLARSCKLASIPYVILEMNAETVKKEKEKGEPIFFGDASHETVLHMVHIEEAKVVVIAINDPTAARRITESVRKANPRCFIVVRTRYLQDSEVLTHLGANEVIADEFETSVEIFTRVLNRYLIPRSEIDQLIADVRSRGYLQMRTNAAPEEKHLSDLQFHASRLNIETFRVQPNSPIANLSMEKNGLRKACGVTVLLLLRGQESLTHIDATTTIQTGDLVILFGDLEGLQKAKVLFEPEMAKV